MAKNALPILVAALGLFAKMAAANHEKHESEFRQCLCWNSTTNDFCGGNDWYNSDACNNWLWHAVGARSIVAFAGMIVLLAFPVLFYLARWCCRCCGGRYATRGCCCADYSSRPTFPGYKNCSIGVTKGLFFGAVAVTIVSSIFLMQNSTKLHTDVNAATSAISETLAAVQPKLDAGNRAALEMATGIMYPAFAPVELALKLDAASKAFPSKHSDVSDTLNTVIKAENHPYWGRNYLAILVPASGLALVFVAVMCALFNQRSFVGLVMVAMCIHTATMAILAVPHHWMSQATEYGCDNFEATLVPLAVGAGQKYGICNNSAITADLKTTATNLQNFATSPDSSFCKDFKTACEAMGTDCQFTPCSDWMSYQKPGTLYFVNYPAVPAEAVKMLNDKINQFSLLAAKLTTVATTNPKAQEAAQRLIDFRTGAIPALRTLLNATVNLNDNCQFARDQMAGPVYNAICNNAANWRAANVSMGFTNLCVFGAWSIVILILGMKRFRKMNSYNLLRGLDHSDEAAPINGQRPLYSYANDNDDAVIVAKVCRASQGGLESDAVSGIVVTEKEVAYPPQRQSYGGTDGVAYNSV